MSNSTRPTDSNAETPGTGPAGSSLVGSAVRVTTRRGLIRAGLRASPIVLTLASRPVLAWQCKTPSAHASANLSNHVQDTWPEACTATSTAWLSKCTNQSTGVDACGGGLSFPTSPITVTKLTPCNTLMGSGVTTEIRTVLGSGSGFDKTMICAMLNVLTGRVPSGCVTAQILKDMYAAGNAYQVSPGIVWSKQDIVNYLHNNWIATVSIFGGTPPTA